MSIARTPKRGEIWLVDFDPAVGAEIRKIRPAVVANQARVGRLPLHIVAPLTDWRPRYASWPWFVHIPMTVGNGLTKASAADTFQIKSMSELRFVRYVGLVTDEEMAAIASAITLCIGAP